MRLTQSLWSKSVVSECRKSSREPTVKEFFSGPTLAIKQSGDVSLFSRTSSENENTNRYYAGEENPLTEDISSFGFFHR